MEVTWKRDEKMEKSKDLYIEKAKKYFKFNKDVKTAFINQINKFYELNSNFRLQPNDYNIGDFLVLKSTLFFMEQDQQWNTLMK